MKQLVISEGSEETPNGALLTIQSALQSSLKTSTTAQLSVSRDLTSVASMIRANNMRRAPVSLLPHMAIITSIIFGIDLAYSLIRRKLTWHRIAQNIVVWSCSVGLLHLSQPREVWTFCLALGYTVWNLLPGSFTSLNLPTHSTFMRTLEVQDKQAECMVCWEELCLAALPCRHEACERCLQLMGDDCQTACPMCRKPLFGVLDWQVLAAMKTSVVSMAITSTICFPEALHEILRRHYLHGGIWMACHFLVGFMLWLIVTRGIIPRKETWWRLTPGAWRLGNVCVMFGASIYSVVLKLWLFEGKFR